MMDKVTEGLSLMRKLSFLLEIAIVTGTMRLVELVEAIRHV